MNLYTTVGLRVGHIQLCSEHLLFYLSRGSVYVVLVYQLTLISISSCSCKKLLLFQCACVQHKFVWISMDDGVSVLPE